MVDPRRGGRLAAGLLVLALARCGGCGGDETVDPPDEPAVDTAQPTETAVEETPGVAGEVAGAATGAHDEAQPPAPTENPVAGASSTTAQLAPDHATASPDQTASAETDITPADWADFAWERPHDGAVGSNPDVSVWGRAPAGARVWLRGQSPRTITGDSFNLSFRPRAGDNVVRLHVEIAGEERQFSRRFHYFDRSRLVNMLSTIHEQRDVLGQLETIRNELARALDESAALIPKMSPRDRQEAEALAGELRVELLELDRLRKELDHELVTSLDEINSLDKGR